jgi:hypothetical protein
MNMREQHSDKIAPGLVGPSLESDLEDQLRFQRRWRFLSMAVRNATRYVAGNWTGGALLPTLSLTVPSSFKRGNHEGWASIERAVEEGSNLAPK